MNPVGAILELRRRSDRILMAAFLAVFVVGTANAVWLTFSI